MLQTTLLQYIISGFLDIAKLFNFFKTLLWLRNVKDTYYALCGEIMKNIKISQDIGRTSKWPPRYRANNVLVSFYVQKSLTLETSWKSSFRSEKNRRDDLGATVPDVVKNCNLLSTKACASLDWLNLFSHRFYGNN